MMYALTRMLRNIESFAEGYTTRTWLPAYEWSQHFKSDLVSAIVITLYGIPQGLAYATLVGVPTYYGLYCNIVPPLVYAHPHST